MQSLELELELELDQYWKRAIRQLNIISYSAKIRYNK